MSPAIPSQIETEASFTAPGSGPHTVLLWSDQESPKELSDLQRYSLATRGCKYAFTNAELHR